MGDKYSKSIDFFLENAGPVIQYRLRKEILKDLLESESFQTGSDRYDYIPSFAGWKLITKIKKHYCMT